MLNTISGPETAVEARAGFGMGAALSARVRTVQPARAGAVFVHRRPFRASDVFGRCHVAGLNVALGQRNASKQYPHTTRIARLSGDAKGPHTAREPV